MMSRLTSRRGLPLAASVLVSLGCAVASPAASPSGPAPTPAQARDRLEDLWEAGIDRLPDTTAPVLTTSNEAALPAPERKALATASITSFEEPVELSSGEDHTLSVELVCMKAHNRIGADPVFLRSYNGKLVGPTLRAKPGDTIYIKLKNHLEPDTRHDGPMNTLHDFSTTNLHTHGLHVSPSGNSDNVLLEIPSLEDQDYKIEIPADHPAGTFWYHPHKHGSTAAQVSSGMSGALIIEGGMDEVPEIAAARDRIFVLQQIPYLYKNCFPKEDKSQPPDCYDLPEGVIEQEYVDLLFGPRSWNKLGRYTTINGQQLPVLHLRPGAVERWRFIHSGVRERLELKLEAATATSGAAPATLPLHMIAADGLPLGKVDTLPSIELWPGYRADALVQAPPTPGEYLLIDEATPASVSLNQQAEPRKYLARVIVEGEPLAMALPKDAQLAPFRLPSLPAVTRPDQLQSASYGIINNPKGEGIIFAIDGKTFEPGDVRRLRLGDIQEWTLTSVNDVGRVSHPFHIHVNPFEVVSMIDDQGVERLREPIWRDTIILHEKWKVKMRTHYTDFPGAFVQHCHILDHEDEGMMQIVEIYDPAKPAAAPLRLTGHGSPEEAALPERLASPLPAPAFSLADGAGRAWTPADFAGAPALLVFVKGAGCVHCVEQLQLLTARAGEFRARGIKILAVSTDTAAQVRDSLAAGALPFPVVSDSALAAFRAYGAAAGDEARHGLFLLDGAGAIRWRMVSADPFTGFGLVLAEAERIQKGTTSAAVSPVSAIPSAPAVEIQIRDTAAPGDDYIDWAPAPARIRLVPGTSAADLSVLLANDPPRPAPSGRELPLDGDVLFDRAVAPGRTASQATLALNLPRDGSWVPFVIAGKFPQASTQDKDALIEVRSAADPSGPVIGRQALMVRIRKDHRSLTAGERRRFLDALDYLNRRAIGPDGRSRYLYFVRMHQVSAMGYDFGTEDSATDYFWPDLSHKGPGFIAWHRAFLLLFEREIQKTHPDVALPYWVMNESSVLFTEDFMGANPVDAKGTPVAARFAPDNPLYGWTADIDDARHELLQRFSWGRQPGDDNFQNFFSDDILFQNFKDYSLYPKKRVQGGFVEAMESNPHNIGHNWTGPWMQNCKTSPRDPIFWIFHTGFDRQWAHWQHLYGRFDPTGAGGSYCPLGDFNQPGPDCAETGMAPNCNDRSSNPCVPVNHRLADLLWPWGGQTGKGSSQNNSYPQPDLAADFLAPFPASPTPGLWPSSPARPTPGDMIDYLGLTRGRAPMGFAYDDTPYGTAPKSLLRRRAASEDRAVGVFLNARRSLPQRLAAAQTLSPAALDEQSEVAGALELMGDARADDALRIHALRLAHGADAAGWLPEAIELVKLSGNGGAALDAEAVQLLTSTLMFTPIATAQREEIVDTLELALADPREPVRLAALWNLAPMAHSAAVADVLTHSLHQPAGAPFAPRDAIKGLALARQALANAPLIRPYLDSSDPAERAAAVAALGADAQSRPAILRLIADPAQPREVRVAGLQALPPGDPATLPALLDLIADPGADAELRSEALATLGVAVRSLYVPIPHAGLEEARRRLGQLAPADAERFGGLLARTVLDLTRRLETK